MKKLSKVKVILSCILAAIIAVSVAIGVTLFVKEKRLNDLQDAALSELADAEGTYNPNKIVLSGTNVSRAKTLAEKIGATLRITSDGSFATLTLPEDTTVADVYSERANREYLSDFSLDYYSKTSDVEETTERLTSAPNYTVSDTEYEKQTYINYLNVGSAWSSYTGSGITVAVIDTGIDTDHSEFMGRISEYSYNATEDKIVKDYTTDDGEYDWSLIEDEQGHGTAVAGTIAASMDGTGTVGIAPNVTLLIIKAECNANGQFVNSSDLVFGLYYAIERDADVVNMSFGSGSNIYADAAKLAVDSDIICVAAAGNDSTAQLTYPAADENVIGVGALADGSWELASYSNYGENSDIVAPGTVYTTAMGGGYKTINGTSFASPIVAAAVALYRQQNTNCEFADVVEMLQASSYDLGDLGDDWYFGYGALDINAFICEERGTVTFNMLTDELENTEQIFIRNHTLQNLPEPERNYCVFDGWYYDIDCTEELNWYEDVFTTDLTLYANWVNEDDGVPYTYVTLDDDTIEIRSYTGKRRYITIPDMIEGKVVSSIGDFAFSGETRLRQVNLPSGLNHIGLSAFYGCTNLISMSIPEGVTEIESGAFENCARLSSVSFADDAALTTIGSEAFAYTGLRTFDVPKNVASLDGSAFFGATSLKAINVAAGNKNFVSDDGVLFNSTKSTLVAYPAGLASTYSLPSSVTAIGGCAFGYTKLTTIELNNVTSIGGSAFACSSLESVTIPDSVTSLGSCAFYAAYYLKEVTLGSGITSIPEKAFMYDFSLASITIPSQITQIGSSAFAYAGLISVTFAENSSCTLISGGAFSVTGLKEITIPKSVMVIGGGVFYKDFSLSSVTFESGSNLQQIGGSAFAATYSLTTITLPENLQYIGGYAFQDSALTGTVTIPASVTTLGAGAFASCHNLTDIEVEDANTVYADIDGVVYTVDSTTLTAYPAGNTRTSYTVNTATTIIYDSAFYGSANLNYVYLPESLTEIQQYAFYENTALRTISIPDNVTQVGRYSFAQDYSLQSITLSDDSKLPRISYGAFAYTGIYSMRVPANVSTIAQGAFEGSKNLTSFTFAANSKLESISAYMFDGCDKLTTITFESGSSLTSIQAHGLEGMAKLTTVDFGDAALTNIDNYAFRYCESLQTLTIPDGVTYIGRYAFYGDKNLTSLTLPTSIDYIGRNAFYGAENLNLYFASDILPQNLQENWDNGIAGYYVGVTEVVTSGDWQYATLTDGGIAIIKYSGTDTTIDLTTLDLGGDIVQIGGYAFWRNTVESITLPDSLTSIQQYAFALSNITAVTIPANVTFIGKYAFYHTPLTSVTFAESGKLYSVEQYAFAKCASLTSVKIPASLTKLGTAAFLESGLTSVDFTASTLTEIPQLAFSGTSLTSVVLPASVTTLNHSAFRDCLSLASVTFAEENDVTLYSNVFYNSGLQTVTITANVTYIGEYSFVGLTELKEFVVDENNTKYTAIDGVLYNKDGTKLIAMPAGRTGEFTVPKSVETIGFGAFENSSLSKVSFESGINLLTLGYRAFYNAENLTEINIPASVVSIDYYAFAYCDNLTTVTFAEDNKLTGIYEGAFYGCKNLKNITIPDSIIEISDFAFYGCMSLTSVPVSETSELKGIYDYAFAYTGITNLTIPDTVIDIGEYAFRGARLKSVTIPDTNKLDLVISLGAFADCESLEEITLPFIGASYEDTDITWFGYIFGAGAYKANNTYVPESLKTVTISEGITFVGYGAFYGLENLEKINVPNTVTGVYYYAFEGCSTKYELANVISCYGWNGELVTEITSDYFGENIFGSLVLAEGVTSIGYGAFLSPQLNRF